MYPGARLDASPSGDAHPLTAGNEKNGPGSLRSRDPDWSDLNSRFLSRDT